MQRWRPHCIIFSGSLRLSDFFGGKAHGRWYTSAMKHIIYFIWFTLLLFSIAACKAPPECPTIAPYRISAAMFADAIEPDPDIVRIFNGKATRKPPSYLRWAPDGNTIALLEDAIETDGTPRLWLVDVPERRKRPLFIGEDITVQGFEWLDAGSLVVQSKEKILRVSVDGVVSDIMAGNDAISGITPSPDGTQLAYRKDNNLFVYALSEKIETQLTFNTDSGVCSGCVSWLYEEEFETARGFEWSKDSRRIWYRTVDQRAVETTAVALESPGESEIIPYSHPGKNNPRVTVSVISVGDKGGNAVVVPVAGNNEWYIPEVMWHPATDALILTRMDRLQTRFELLQCTLENEPACTEMFSRTDPRWINYPGLPLFTPDHSRYAMRLELDNFARVVLFNSADNEYTRLSTGEFPIQKINGIDNQFAYVTAAATDPLNQGVHRVSLTDGTMQPISDQPGTHDANCAPMTGNTPGWFIDTFSTIDATPVLNLCSETGQTLMRIDTEPETEYQPSPDVVNEFLTMKSPLGDTLYVHLTRPSKTGDKKYPALVYVYGGPRYQAVQNRFNTTFTAWRNLMARRGFVVFTLDNRGSGGRGRTFEVVIHRNLGAAALEDQLFGVEWLKRQPYVDGNRLGIIGWSFGGTMVLNALLKTDNVFQLGVAIAPVTDWQRYDTAYTERYMQRPQDNPENYDATDLTRLTDGLTEKLMLVHGTGDRNVLFAHSEAFIQQSSHSGKSVIQLFYPGQGHSIKDRRMRTHLFSEITKFIARNL